MAGKHIIGQMVVHHLLPVSQSPHTIVSFSQNTTKHNLLVQQTSHNSLNEPVQAAVRWLLNQHIVLDGFLRGQHNGLERFQQTSHNSLDKLNHSIPTTDSLRFALGCQQCQDSSVSKTCCDACEPFKAPPLEWVADFFELPRAAQKVKDLGVSTELLEVKFLT